MAIILCMYYYFFNQRRLLTTHQFQTTKGCMESPHIKHISIVLRSRLNSNTVLRLSTKEGKKDFLRSFRKSHECAIHGSSLYLKVESIWYCAPRLAIMQEHTDAVILGALSSSRCRCRHVDRMSLSMLSTPMTIPSESFHCWRHACKKRLYMLALLT